MRKIRQFISQEAAAELKADAALTCDVTVTMKDGTQYNSCFFQEEIDVEDFETTLNQSKEFLTTTLRNVKHRHLEN